MGLYLESSSLQANTLGTLFAAVLKILVYTWSELSVLAAAQVTVAADLLLQPHFLTSSTALQPLSTKFAFNVVVIAYCLYLYQLIIQLYLAVTPA